MAIHKHFGHFLLFLAFFALSAGVLSGCQDKISSLGIEYYKDTIASQTSIRNDASFIQFADTVRPQVTANGVNFGLTDSTTIMLIGQVPSENLTSWGVLQFLPMTSDTDTMISHVKLLLKDREFSYGDTTNNQVSYLVYPVFGTVVDSSYQQPALPPTPIGSVDTLFEDTTDHVLRITIDSAIPNLTASSLEFVIVPMSKMDNIRGFGTIHNYSSDANSIPQIVYYLKNGDSIFRYPTLDFHLVKDGSSPPAGEFTVQGSTGKREKVTLDLTRPTDTAGLSAFTTINDATLVLHLDMNNSRLANVTNHVYGPYVVSLGSTDSACHSDGTGILDSTNGVYTYKFQIRGLVENWLRTPSQNLGIVLQAGFATHSFSTASEIIGVEDYNVDRWTFYGPTSTDTSKRPYFILSYSKLK